MMAARNVRGGTREAIEDASAFVSRTPFGGFGSRFRVHPPQSGFPANFAYASPKTKHKNAVAAMEGESWRRFAERSGNGDDVAPGRGGRSRDAPRDAKTRAPGEREKGSFFVFSKWDGTHR